MRLQVPEQPESGTSSLAGEPLLIGAVVSGWALTGLTVAVFAVRLGHARRTWLGLGVALGPLLLGLLVLHRSPRSQPGPLVVTEGDPGGGSVSVLIALLGKAEDAAEAAPFLRAQGDRLGLTTLCRIVDVETLIDDGWSAEKDAAARVLDDASLFLTDVRPSQVLLAGAPAEALSRYARHHAVDHVLVLGDSRVQRAIIDDRRLGGQLMVVASPGTPTT